MRGEVAKVAIGIWERPLCRHTARCLCCAITHSWIITCPAGVRAGSLSPSLPPVVVVTPPANVRDVLCIFSSSSLWPPFIITEHHKRAYICAHCVWCISVAHPDVCARIIRIYIYVGRRFFFFVFAFASVMAKFFFRQRVALSGRSSVFAAQCRVCLNLSLSLLAGLKMTYPSYSSARSHPPLAHRRDQHVSLRTISRARIARGLLLFCIALFSPHCNSTLI